MRYFITFSCYGTHLHGDDSGSVDRRHNQPGGVRYPAIRSAFSSEYQTMNQDEYRLDGNDRAAVLVVLQDVCFHRGWTLLAAHVRTTHVHVVVDADIRPERAMNDFKSYAGRGLNRLGNDGVARKRWTRHGSTRWLWKDQDVREAIRYVVEEQGKPMAVFVSDEL